MRRFSTTPRDIETDAVKTPRRTWKCVLYAAASLAVIFSAACGSAPSGTAQTGGPLHSEMSDGRIDLAMAYLIVGPGQDADAEAYVTNAAEEPVDVLAVSVVPVPGEPAAHLAEAGVATTGAGVATARGWPPPAPVRKLVGGQLPQGNSGIIFALTATVTGKNYAVSGLKITYSYHGGQYSAIAWAGEAVCVAASDSANDPSCAPFASEVNGVIQEMLPS